MVADAIDRSRYQVEVVHLGEQADRVVEAEAAGACRQRRQRWLHRCFIFCELPNLKAPRFGAFFV
jgi:hypothetical protein